MNAKLLTVTLLLHWSFLAAYSLPQQTIVYGYSPQDQSQKIVSELVKNHGISIEWVAAINPNDDHLYIIADAFQIPEHDMPKNYIIYQSLDLTLHKLTDDYLNKLQESVAVWDYSKENIAHYSTTVKHFYHVPNNYEFADPIILPCFLPMQALQGYKQLLSYSNTLDTDISSHLPTIYCYSIVQNPRLILEAGVRGGESTKAFEKVLSIYPTELIGLDYDCLSAGVYSSIKNAQFFCMDDRNFTTFYQASAYKDRTFDIIFIDTSHTYAHTLQEIQQFEKLLSRNGILVFHDSNVTPFNHDTTYYRINGTSGYAVGNTRGVTQAIKEYFSLTFDEYQYCNNSFTKNGSDWHITHYPYCNGLTIIRLLERN